MQKEEKIVVVLLLMALGSLAVAFWAFAPHGGELEGSSNSVSQKDPGISVDGMVTEINPTRTGENLLIRLDSTSIPIFISRTSGAKGLSSSLKIGDRVMINGNQKEFQGQKEIEVSRSSDVRVIN